MAKPDLGEVSGILRKIHAQMVANANQRTLPRNESYPRSRGGKESGSRNPRLDDELARSQERNNKLRRQERQLIEQEAKAQREYQREREEFFRREKRLASLERRAQSKMDSERRKRVEDQLKSLKKEHEAQIEHAKLKERKFEQTKKALEDPRRKREMKDASRDERRLSRLAKVEEKRLKNMEKMAMRPGRQLGNAILDRFAPGIQGVRGAGMAAREQKRLAKISNMMVPSGSSPAAIQTALSGAKPAGAHGMAGLAMWAASAIRGATPVSAAASGVPPGGGGGAGAALAAGAAGMAPPQAQLALKLWGVVKDTVTGSANMYDDLLKLSARYVKSTNQIPQTLDEAVSKLGHFRSMFTTTYADLIKSTMTFGASSQEAFKVLEDAVLRIRPAGADMDQQLKDITESTFIYARGFNMSTDQVFSAMEDSILRFGKSARDVRSDLAEMYTAFGDNIKRVDEFADIIFASARQANIWSLNYGEVASLLASISKRATEAGMSEKRRQELASGVADIATQQQVFTQQQVGERFIQEIMPSLSGRRENAGQDTAMLLSRGVQKEVIPQLLDAVRLAKKEGGYGSQALLGELLNGSKLGNDYKFEALQKTLLQMADNESRMLAVKNSGLFGEVNSLGIARQIAEFVRKGEFKQASALAGKTPEEARAAAESKLSEGGARVTEMAATGLVDAMKNLTKATVDLKNVYASQTFGLLEKLLGKETTTQRMESEQQLSSEEYKRLEEQFGIPSERTALYKKHNITALGTEGGAFGAYATNIEQEVRTPEFQRMDESRQRMHLFKKFGDEGMTPQAASELVSQLASERADKLRGLSSNQDFMSLTPMQKMQMLQSEFGMTEEEAAAQLKTMRKDRGMPSPTELPPPAAGMPLSSPAVNPPSAGGGGVNIGVAPEVGGVTIDPQSGTATVTTTTKVKIDTTAMENIVANVVNSNSSLSSSANQ